MVYSSITVFLADDHQIVLRGICSLIDLESDLKLVGFTTQSAEIIPQVLRLRPQVLVLDLGMPGIPGGEIIRRLHAQRDVHTAIIVFTMHKDISYVVQSLEDGASGYVMKDVDSTHLIKAIRAAARGQTYLSPPFTQEAIWEYQERLLASKGGADFYDKLTPREREVLIYVAQGYTNRQIAEKMHVSVRTAERHRYNMMKKATFRNKAEVIRYAVRRGLIPSSDDEGLAG